MFHIMDLLLSMAWTNKTRVCGSLTCGWQGLFCVNGICCTCFTRRNNLRHLHCTLSTILFLYMAMLIQGVQSSSKTWLFMVLATLSNRFPMRSQKLWMLKTWPLIVHKRFHVRMSLGMSIMSPKIVHAKRWVFLILLNGVSSLWSWMQANHSSLSLFGMDWWSNYHIGHTNCIRMVDCH